MKQNSHLTSLHNDLLFSCKLIIGQLHLRRQGFSVLSWDKNQEFKTTRWGSYQLIHSRPQL